MQKVLFLKISIFSRILNFLFLPKFFFSKFGFLTEFCSFLCQEFSKFSIFFLPKLHMNVLFFKQNFIFFSKFQKKKTKILDFFQNSLKNGNCPFSKNGNSRLSKIFKKNGKSRFFPKFQIKTGNSRFVQNFKKMKILDFFPK